MEFRRDADTEASQKSSQKPPMRQAFICERLQAGQDLDVGELCFLEKLWTDRVRIFKASCQRLARRLAVLTRRCWRNLHAQAGHKGPAGEIPLSRARLSRSVVNYIIPIAMLADCRHLFEVCDLQLTSKADTSIGSRPVSSTHARRTAKSLISRCSPSDVTSKIRQHVEHGPASCVHMSSCTVHNREN